MNSRNGPGEPVFNAIHAVWADAERRFNLSYDERYATGFSGGSRVSFGMARMFKGRFAGIIAIIRPAYDGITITVKINAWKLLSTACWIGTDQEISTPEMRTIIT